MVKNPPANAENARDVNQEDPLEWEMATHSSILAWKIPWTEHRVGYSPWGHKKSDMTGPLRQNSEILQHVKNLSFRLISQLV